MSHNSGGVTNLEYKKLISDEAACIYILSLPDYLFPPSIVLICLCVFLKLRIALIRKNTVAGADTIKVAK
jgi:hypothetical protein